MKSILALICWVMCLGFVMAQKKSPESLRNDHIQIFWNNEKDGWHISKLLVKKDGKWIEAMVPSGEYTLLYSETKPSTDPKETFEKITGGKFPEENYHYQELQWKESTTDVALNKAGKAIHFFPENIKPTKDGIEFRKETEEATIIASWTLDPKFSGDVQVSMKLLAQKERLLLSGYAYTRYCKPGKTGLGVGSRVFSGEFYSGKLCACLGVRAWNSGAPRGIPRTLCNHAQSAGEHKKWCYVIRDPQSRPRT